MCSQLHLALSQFVSPSTMRRLWKKKFTKKRGWGQMENAKTLKNEPTGTFLTHVIVQFEEYGVAIVGSNNLWSSDATSHMSHTDRPKKIKNYLYSDSPFYYTSVIVACYLSETTFSKALCSLSHQEHSLQTVESNGLLCSWTVAKPSKTSDFWPYAAKSFAALEDSENMDFFFLQKNQLIYCFPLVHITVWFRI